MGMGKGNEMGIGMGMGMGIVSLDGSMKEQASERDRDKEGREVIAGEM